MPVVIMVFSVLAVGAVGYFALSTNKEKTSNSNNTNAANVNIGSNTNALVNVNSNTGLNANVTVNTNSSNDATKDWKTYESTRLGFSLRYPASWSPHEQTASVLFLKSATLPNVGATEGYAYGTQFSVSKRAIAAVKAGVTTKEQFLKEVVGTRDPDGNPITQEKVNRGGLDMIRVVMNAAGADGKVLTYYYFSGDSVYTLSHYPYDATSEDSKTFETVVTTFAPTNPTADWKTYESKVFGYSIKYPNTWKIDSTRSSASEVVFDTGVATETRYAIKATKTAQNLEQWRDSLTFETVKQSSSTTIAGEPAIKVEFMGLAGTYYGVRKGDHLYQLTDSGGYMTSSGMFSSFVFTNQ